MSHIICSTRIMGFLRAPSFASVFIFVALNAFVCSNYRGWLLVMVVYEVCIVQAICKYVYVVGGILCAPEGQPNGV